MPGVEEYVRLAQERGGRWVVHGDTVHLVVDPSDLRPIADKIFNEYGACFRTCVGTDERPLNNHFSITHLFTDDRSGLYIALKSYLDPENPVAPSIADVVPAADWCELEAWDMLGIRFEGRRLERLVLPYWWPEGVHPLRKEFDYKSRPDVSLARSERVTLRKEVGTVPLGPYHPALHEPEYFELYVKGERVVDVRYRGFHVHRGIEKLAESRMNYQQVNFLAERICGICGFEHSTCYALAVEKAAGVDVPERAQFIRSIVLEVERLHSHLLLLGVAFHLLGYDAGFMHMWRVRERTMVLAEMLTGSRKTYGINLVGGVRRDINEEKKSKVLSELGELVKDFKRVVEIAVSAPNVKRRLTGTGLLPKEDARRLGVEGPVARGSGIDKDARRDLPYAAYKYASFRVPVYTEGDNMARVLVRVEEVFESVSIIEQLLDKLPKGPIMAEKVEIPPGRVGVQVVEAPRGGDVHYVLTGDGRPYRWRVRAPTYANIPALKVMLRDQRLADAPITIASIDPCFSCTDRVVVVRDDGVVERLEVGASW
ncbi:Membrane-bound hydrogenase, subunit NuoCD [Thermogladius calderae 1633]|uniref:Membrane-bound hydrogenase, subunit NuoCD n=1 Tax=Thermogladius calderae (strain DSM 22663 / VKM B-2946 / 1633) TaxID=1184251 RepID=I3TF83_THEC1|nr:NADH-quinone oxidoreductase subunit C [Thermogladius calderae]AFK51421.1 Membrane-bound hydrogenase, subunit NuoCD [Thermogladius calderae 1633]